ncbi:MAG: type II toxin-antitoxin system VapC family toxin [Acidobacteriota bacterium]
MKLWDTNILSELARRQPHPALLAWVEAEDELAISAVTVDEIFFGLTWQPRPRVAAWLESFIDTRCTVLPVTARIARVGGRLRGRLRAVGQVRTQADMWIAATAEVCSLPLVTRNVKDFEDCGIEVIDPWASERAP